MRHPLASSISVAGLAVVAAVLAAAPAQGGGRADAAGVYVTQAKLSGKAAKPRGEASGVGSVTICVDQAAGTISFALRPALHQRPADRGAHPPRGRRRQRPGRLPVRRRGCDRPARRRHPVVRHADGDEGHDRRAGQQPDEALRERPHEEVSERGRTRPARRLAEGEGRRSRCRRVRGGLTPAPAVRSLTFETASAGSSRRH